MQLFSSNGEDKANNNNNT